jgi:S-DNA-T family DNA segregation ATPase FtsK/SpoIIIE
MSHEKILGQAIRTVIEARYASTALLQRELSIPYSIASMLLDKLEALGLVSKADGVKPRKILN